MKKLFFSGMLMVLMVLGVSVSAEATPLVFVLDTSNTFGNSATGYGTVTLTLMNSGPYQGQIRIDVVMGGSGKTFKIIDTGTHEAFSFNTKIAGPYNASTFTMSGFVPGYPFSANYNPSSNPQFGAFDMALNSTCTNPGSCTPSASSLTFYVGHPNGGFSSELDLVDLTATPEYAYFAVDVLCLTGCSGSGQTGVIGVTKPGKTVTTPEPMTLTLLGLGLTTLALVKRRLS